jgi:hypothetical protein
VFIITLVKELGTLLYKCGDLKLYLCIPRKIIILVNFWYFLQNIWTLLKFESYSNSRNLLKLYFKIYSDLNVWPIRKVVYLDKYIIDELYIIFTVGEDPFFYFWIQPFELDLDNLRKFKRSRAPAVSDATAHLRARSTPRPGHRLGARRITAAHSGAVAAVALGLQCRQLAPVAFTPWRARPAPFPRSHFTPSPAHLCVVQIAAEGRRRWARRWAALVPIEGRRQHLLTLLVSFV